MALINEIEFKNGLNDIGNAIREKTGGTELIPFKEMASAIQGISSGGGAELNIAYGDTEPDDTSKLWIKANEPESIVFGSNFEGVESISILDTVLPSAYSRMACARVGTKIYLFGGYIDSYTRLDTINVFDTETETITTLSATLPTKCFDIVCAPVGTKIYLFGGSTNNNRLATINVFDTETETINTLSTTFSGGSQIGCAPVGTKIYLFGAYYNTSNRSDLINVFDTETETITTLSATLPTDYYAMACASFGTKIYLFGGDRNYSPLDTIHIFDTETQTISTLSTVLPTKCFAMGCASVGTKIYLFGGQRGRSTRLDTINVFDIDTETITTLSTTLPVDCGAMGCASVGNEMYLLGGENSNGVRNTINKFTLTHDLAQNNIEIITAYKNFFNVVNTDTMKVEIGVDSVLIGNAENQAENCEAYLYQNESWVQI